MYIRALNYLRNIHALHRINIALTKASLGLYYGVSIAAWKKLFLEQGYKFVTVDSRGVNAFFVDPAYFKNDFIEGLSGSNFQENLYQFRKYHSGYQKQCEIFNHLPLYNLVCFL